MFRRKSLAGLAAVAMTGSLLAFAAGPANAVYNADPDDVSGFTPVSADLIVVGSDTSQHAVKLLADGWNSADATAAGFKIQSYAATGGGTIPLPTTPASEINRPNGSGSGKNQLFGASNQPEVDIARASDSVGDAANSAQKSAGLMQFPFALDTVGVAVSNATPSHAPATLTGAQILDIFKCNTTDWASVGGTAGTIKPVVPQSGSGTLKFFNAQLTALNGGTAIDASAQPCVQQVQEHDPAPIQNDADVIGPFSVGRAAILAGSPVRIVSGWSASRALYNVVRGTQVDDPKIQAVLGENGFFCSSDATSLIASAGFKQLAATSVGGVCGQQTNETTTNFLTAGDVHATSTTTALTATVSAQTVTLRATVTPVAAGGTIAFFDGATKVAGPLALASGAAQAQLTGVAGGSHSYRAVFTPADDRAYSGSQSAVRTVTVTVGPSQECTDDTNAAAAARTAYDAAVAQVASTKTAAASANAALAAAKGKVAAATTAYARAKAAVAKAKKAVKKAHSKARKAKAKKQLTKAKRTLGVVTSALATAKRAQTVASSKSAVAGAAYVAATKDLAAKAAALEAADDAKAAACA